MTFYVPNNKVRTLYEGTRAFHVLLICAVERMCFDVEVNWLSPSEAAI